MFVVLQRRRAFVDNRYGTLEAKMKPPVGIF
jgi:hypothetical protein